ncbi:MAG: transcription termination/antitermination protein NusA, partial [Pirellulales bacterium]
GVSHHPHERVRATNFEVKKQGPRIRIILSRIRPALVQRLFEQEIPEIADGVIEIRAMAREPGYRTKVAVSSNDQRVDCLGACVGQRGNRIKNIVDELSGERIDIVRWSDDMQVLIPNSLQPAEVEEVILCKMLGRAIVLVREDQLSLAIGRRGQNVRLASKLCGWDIEIMTRDELDETIDRAVTGFSAIEGVDDNLSGKLVEEGYLSYSDLSIIEPDDLMRMGNLTEEQVDAIVAEAEVREEQAEHAAAEARRKQREQDRIAAATAADPAPEEPAGDTAGEGAESSEPAADEAGVSAVANTEEASTEEASSEEVANNGEAASDDSTPDAAAVPKAEPAAGNDEPQP